MSPSQSDGAVRKDSELMRRIAAGDTGALRQIMGYAWPETDQTCLRYCRPDR